ncbi:unnamed protein product [Diplocarpon coronariae]|uniref:Uncharacterized protein n=1 Tax=Diplocarpon coronariae TaxID=2795749 RepID=A0A218YUL4_9HELO|nr:hypothetical protein JHW43_008620 [Diplocarpon mali]OWO99271.1 hypothetical protein B2J93_1159 [Marssonina coronariae]
MTESKKSGPSAEPPRRQNDLPPELLEIIVPALEVGGVSGMCGLVVGGFTGIIRSSTPVLFALVSGIQWSVLGATFWASRRTVLHAWGKEELTPKEKISASTIAGGFAGTAGGLLRGRKNVIPGAIMFTLFGATGQALYNMADARVSKLSELPEKNLKDSWLNSKWSPMKVLSDAEYETMLQEKLLRVNAQIALVDESIEALRGQEREIATKKKFDESKISKMV